MKHNKLKLTILLLVIAFVACFFAFDLQQYLTLAYLKGQQEAFQNFYFANQFITLAIYMVIYIAVTALSLPGATVMTLAGGALFGTWIGLLAVSFASSIGATIAFLVSRFLLKDYVQSKFGDKLDTINTGIKTEGAFYLFTLRLVPLFPFFMINLVMALTPIKTAVFYIISQIGMLPGTFVYVNAGTQLGKLDSLQGILSPGLLFSFALLGIFPLIAKKILNVIKRVIAKDT